MVKNMKEMKRATEMQTHIKGAECDNKDTDKDKKKTPKRGDTRANDTLPKERMRCVLISADRRTSSLSPSQWWVSHDYLLTMLPSLSQTASKSVSHEKKTQICAHHKKSFSFTCFNTQQRAANGWPDPNMLCCMQTVSGANQPHTDKPSTLILQNTHTQIHTSTHASL